MVFHAFLAESRYYDPEIGRFINADSYASTDVTGLLSTNMFAYCENDPVNRSDPSGEIWATVAKMAVGATISAATYTVGQLIAVEQIDAVNLAISAGEGALTAVSGTTVGAII